MTSIEKVKLIMAIDKRHHLARIKTADGETYVCKLLGYAEDEEDDAYDVIMYSDGKRRKKLGNFVLEMNFIETIEELPA